MRRILFAHIHLPLALVLLVAFTLGASALVAVQAHAAFLNFGGRISVVTPCILDTPSPPAKPTTCTASCPLCSITWPADTCASRVEVRFQPTGGNGNFACPGKVQFYRGGGKYPRPAGWSLWNAILPGGDLEQAGIGN